MITRVKWSKSAEIRLDKIHGYYIKKRSINYANKLVSSIIQKADILIESPFIGQVDPFITHRVWEYRYLVLKNYKIIYTVHEDLQIILIADVFDTRQDPEKLGSIH